MVANVDEKLNCVHTAVCKVVSVESNSRRWSAQLDQNPHLDCWYEVSSCGFW